MTEEQIVRHFKELASRTATMHRILNESDLYDNMAKAYAGFVQRLIENGFSRKEAIEIVKATGGFVKAA